jgi:hypothetical protein
MWWRNRKKTEKVTEFTNQDASKLVASQKSGKDLKEYADNSAALAAGLVAGDLYTTSGAVKIVTA